MEQFPGVFSKAKSFSQGGLNAHGHVALPALPATDLVLAGLFAVFPYRKEIG
nr:hypothetical protein [Sinorhizobium meliloti]